MTTCGPLGFAATLKYPDGFSVTYRIIEILDPANAVIFTAYQFKHGTPTFQEPTPKSESRHAA